MTKVHHWVNNKYGEAPLLSRYRIYDLIKGLS